MGELKKKAFRLGEWRVDPELNRISAGTATRELDPRVMDVLAFLATREGKVVRRDELVAAVWGEHCSVTENTIVQSLSRLRKALGDDWRRPRYVETISKSGYRLMAPVRPVASPEGTADASVPAADAPVSSDPARPVRAGTAASSTFRLVGAGVVLVLAVAVAWCRSTHDPREPIEARQGIETQRFGPPPPEPLPAVTLIGQEHGAVLSPDGSKVAFAWQEKDSMDVYVKEIGAENLVRMAGEDENEMFPAWSPDGAALAFGRGSEEKGCRIYRVGLLDRVEERLGDCRMIRDLDWSPDGRHLAFTDVPEPEAVRRIVLLDLESGEQRELSQPREGVREDRFPVFSPDGRHVAFRRSTAANGHALHIVPVGGGPSRRLTADPGVRIRGHDWTPDGREIVFASDRDGRFALWCRALEGGEPERLPLTDPYWFWQPDLARQTGRLIYTRISDVVDLWTFTLDETGAIEGEASLTFASTRSEIQPQLSPTGERVAFVSNRGGYFEVWSARVDSGELIQHSRFEGVLLSSPRWSPDGRLLAFDAETSGQRDLYVVASDSRAPRRLTSEASEERTPSFSRDGRRIYFASDRSGSWQIWWMPAGGGEAMQVTTGGGLRALEDRAGEYLYYAKREAAGLWRLRVSGGEEEKVLDSPGAYDWGTWEIGTRGIYTILRERPNRIVLHRFDSGETVILHTLEKDRGISFSTPALTVSHDEKTILFAKVRQSEDEIMWVDLWPIEAR